MSVRRARRVRLCLGLACLAATPAPSRAQEFTPALPAPIERGAAALLDSGLPSGRPGGGLELTCLAARPFGLAALDTGAAIGTAAWRGARLGLGIARVGANDLGWDALGAAIGWAASGAGCAVRVTARRDHAASAGLVEEGGGVTGAADQGAAMPAGRETGGEIGLGAWIAPDAALLAWVVHPQLATLGASPPLRRGLEFGIGWRGSATAAWLATETAPHAEWPDAHRAGLALGTVSARAWVEARDGPLRGALGVSGRTRALEAAAIVEAHPVLGESVRLELSLVSRATP